MTEIKRVVWVLQHPTPYNIHLLNGLNRRLSVPSEAFYRWETLPSHPWKNVPERDFPHWAACVPGERDAHLERVCESDQSALVIFAGWRDRTILPALLSRWRRKLPYAFWSDTPKVEAGIARGVLNGIQVFFTRRAHAMLATGSPAISSYLSMGVAAGKVKNFPFVVDPVHFAPRVPRQESASVSEAISFVVLGRLIDKLKGQRVAIEALSKVKQRLPNVKMKLILAGIGRDEDQLRSHAKNVGVDADVEFRGWVDYDSLPALFAEATALVMPSHWDPFPVAVIEAMTAGLPILGSSACGTVRDRVTDGLNGFTHSAGDVDALAGHMEAIAASPRLSAEMGARSLDISREWGVERAAGVIESLIKEVPR